MVNDHEPRSGSELSYKAQAKRLRAFLAGAGIAIKHTHALEAVAKMHGIDDWHALQEICRRHDELDSDVEPQASGLDIKSLADPFVNLANARVEAGGMTPELVGDGMLYGTARYMAFLITRQEAAGFGGLDEHLPQLVHAFAEYMRRHIAQLPSACPHPDHQQEHRNKYGSAEHGKPSEEQLALAQAVDPLLRSMANMDVALMAYLRGRGQGDLASKVALELSSVQSNDDWDLRYSRRLYELMESGELARHIGTAVISTMLMQRMLTEQRDGYMRDPSLDDETRRYMAKFFAEHQLHSLSTLVRKDIAKYQSLIDDGTSELLGPAAVAMKSAFKAAQKAERR